MWAAFKKLFAKSKNFRALFGDVLFQTNPVKGQSGHSTFQWQVKKGLDQGSFYVGVKLIADGYMGPEGSPTNYISFDLATAEQIRADIDECLAVARHFGTDKVPH
ncbi:hypothetical protein [Bradyrhizobium sp.]|jgi:hypothetical protein|uniref:hypothetical protein n=1 Tax=Bradyrhizobium sp. TaxID=376 RepID=UPI003C23D703